MRKVEGYFPWNKRERRGANALVAEIKKVLYIVRVDLIQKRTKMVTIFKENAAMRIDDVHFYKLFVLATQE